ncbi:nonsense-mediated mRNA decay [Cordyceps militaris]|uniref:Nonsense-mediated mRNA decay n=1 Tax=Cordyceps militaris TaxID=73501 RepID=A0A2H4S7Z5_CORMI|nr:nonsense-mediated mRNA decay [Cordyceps militaris]
MSTKAPQVSSRRTNGAANTAGQGNESGKGKVGREGGNSRLKKRRGQGEKKNDNVKGRDTEAQKPPRQRQQNEGVKLILRRLPPGMTEAECVAILSDAWTLGKGKVDWFSFIPGKISTDPSKPSRPARAYIHLVRKDDTLALSETVRAATWEDAKNSFTSPALVGPPSLELSAYKKVPSSKKRTDTRQGTIDQDPEFMAFLEGLANPAPLRESADLEDGDDANKGESKVTTTPLVEYLKEKKANKSKDSSSGKKRGDGRNKSKEDEPSKKKGRESRAERTERAEKGSKTTVKILTKKAATEQAVDAAKIAAKAINTTLAQDVPKSRRAGIATAARILQRDLGLSPGSAHRRARQDAAKADAKPKDVGQIEEAQNASQPAEPATSNEGKGKINGTTGKSQAGRRGRDARNGAKGTAAVEASSQPTATNPPVILKKKPEGQANAPNSPASTSTTSTTQQNAATKSAAEKNSKPAATNSKAGQSSKKAPSVTAGATRAFVKHAVQSQGVTETALRQALEAFGTITAIEMDKRKGFAYVDFLDHAGLAKAVAASPLAVAQGSVQILERKDKKLPTGVPSTVAGTSTASATTDKDKAKDGENPKEKGETRRGRRGRGGRGNNGGGASNSQATNAPGAQAAPKNASLAASG